MKLLLTAAAGVLSLGGAAKADPGVLVIAGGALSQDNASVFDAFIEAAGGPDARFAILPTASGSAQSFADALAGYGVDRANITRVDLAVLDDPDTGDVDEGPGRTMPPTRLKSLRSTPPTPSGSPAATRRASARRSEAPARARP
ncbi:MAG: hypothetical protein ACLFQ5_02785 [Oceanicaulis sp.]